MPTYGFGAGALWGTPTTDATGAAIANPTPILFGTLQDVSVDLSGDVKQLYGQNQFPDAVARGKMKVDGKAKFARINGLLLNSLFFGQTVSSGIFADYYDVTGTTVPASSPYTLTVTPPSSGTFAADLGVRDSNGNPMTAVASSPTSGQYTVAAGVYTFAAADTGKTVFISYQYTATDTTAKNSTVSNLQMGAAPTFRCDLTRGFNGKYNALSLFACVGTKLSFATKNDDFEIPEFDFSAFADSSGRVLKWGTSE